MDPTANSSNNPSKFRPCPSTPDSVSGGFAVIVLPEFALQAAVRLEKAWEGRPCVLLEERGRKAVAVQVDARARDGGVILGMTAPQVLARCPDAVLLERSPGREALARETLLSAAFTVSPRVEETEEGVCTIDLRGVPCKGLIDRARRLVLELEELGFNPRIGFGGNPLLALYAAREATPVLALEDESAFLAALPLEAADPPPRVAEILHQWGVKTLGTLTALPRDAIAKRLGEEGIALWDRAAGRCDRALRLTSLPEEFEETLELEHEMETLEPLLFVLRRLLGQLTLRLAAVYKVAEEVKLVLGLADESNYERRFRLPEPTRDPDLLFRMLHTHLENVRTESAIIRIHLWMQPCRPVAKQTDLFEATVKDVTGFADTLARLVAIAGSGNVGSPRLEPTHRPDAFRMESLQNTGSRDGSVASKPSRLIRPPMRRFRPPIPAHVRTRNGRPIDIESNVITGRIQNASGPWRLSGDWWDSRRWARDEWDVDLYEGGSYRLVREGRKWFVEGVYG